MASVLILNGPNLNLLGSRSPEVYGTTTFGELEELCRREAGQLGLEAVCRQWKHQGQLIDWIREAGPEVQGGRAIGAVLHPGALTHTYIALRPAVQAVRLPTIDVHI